MVGVEDTGRGIPEEDLEKVFDALYTTKMAGGFGLGLAAVRSIMGAHGGMVRAGPAAGGGPAFVLRFPLHRREGPS